MNYRRIIAEFNATPLAMLPEKIVAIRDFLVLKSRGDHVSEEDERSIVADRRAREDAFLAAAPMRRNEDGSLRAGKVAVVPVFGVLSQRVSMMGAMSGGISTEQIGATLDSLMGDASVKSIVLAFDSPGGSIFGVDELATKIRQARDQKKIVGLADSVAASAAYYLMAQASELVVTPGGQVGSIGVFAAHEDFSKHLEEIHGVKTTLVSAGKYKVEGNPFGPLTEEARSELQSKVDAYYAKFVAAVAKGRGISEARVKSDFGEGRMVMAADAVDRGMADRIGTLEQTLKRLGAYDSPNGAKASVTPGQATARARAIEVE